MLSPLARQSRNFKVFKDGLIERIGNDPTFPKKIKQGESAAQNAIQGIFRNYLLEYWRSKDPARAEKKLSETFYWEKDKKKYEAVKEEMFASKNYPDFIILEPYKVAVEYKQDGSGKTVKQGIGQAMMHTMSREFKYSILLFHDSNEDDRIVSASQQPKEQEILRSLERNYRVFTVFV